MGLAAFPKRLKPQPQMGVVLAATIQQDTAELVLSCLSWAPYRPGAWASTQRQHLWKWERDRRLPGLLSLSDRDVSAADRPEHSCLHPCGPKNLLTGLPERRTRSSSKRGPRTPLLCREDSELAVGGSLSPASPCTAGLHPVLGPVRAVECRVHSTVLEPCVLSECELRFFSIIKV